MESSRRITIYRTSVCQRCRRAAELLREVLSESGLEYDELVDEKFVDKDPAAAEELKRYGPMASPTIRIGNKLLVSDEALHPDPIRNLLAETRIRTY